MALILQSRGAYVARSLAYLIGCIGLLKREKTLHLLAVLNVFNTHKRNLDPGSKEWLRWTFKAILQDQYQSAAEQLAVKKAEYFHATATITVLGLFDTGGHTPQQRQGTDFQ